MSWARAHATLDRHGHRLAARVGVVAVDVGVKLRNGVPTSRPAIRVHVDAKINRDLLRSSRVLPRHLNGVPVDVVATVHRGEAPGCPYSARTLRTQLRPPGGGLAIATRGSSFFGTLGVNVASDDGRSTPFALTAGHVVRAIGDTVVQPPLGRKKATELGVVARRELNERLDVALIKIKPSMKASRLIAGLTNAPIQGILDPIPDSRLPLAITMVGACSGRTQGFVTSKTFSYPIRYSPGHERTVVEMLHLVGAGGADIGRPGDSGALVLDAATKFAVGLYFAGEPTGTIDFGIAIPIRRVLAALAVRFP